MADMKNPKDDLAGPGPVWKAAEAWGFDMSLIEDNLHLTPAQRIQNHASALSLAETLREAMRRKRNGES